MKFHEISSLEISDFDFSAPIMHGQASDKWTLNDDLDLISQHVQLECSQPSLIRVPNHQARHRRQPRPSQDPRAEPGDAVDEGRLL